ncbi:ribonuclease H-like protein [Auriculariales sp. MPI-PUGE-AT-0066]|nr:ribonuclease H-like protein [Auriculariales sp. MPI-PUGE-AT-0066]
MRGVHVSHFCFCASHGLEHCSSCSCDYRLTNNRQIEEYIEQYRNEDLRDKADELLDDRSPLRLLRWGEPSKAFSKDGERVYKCFEHRTRNCNVCFAFVRHALEEIGQYRDLDDDESSYEDVDLGGSDPESAYEDIYLGGSDPESDEESPPPLERVIIQDATSGSRSAATMRLTSTDASVYQTPPASQPNHPSSTTGSYLPNNPLLRSFLQMSLIPRGARRGIRPQRPSNPEIVASMTRPYSPRRFMPPSQVTRPQDLFYDREDFSAHGFERLFHKDDDATMLVYTDGACLDQGPRRPGQRRRAGCAIVYANRREPLLWPLEGRVNGPEQTSNRAELRAILYFLQVCKWESGGADRFVVATDSEYVVEGICSRLNSWVQRDWRTAAGNAVANRDLWEALLNEVEQREALGYSVLFWKIDRSLNARADDAAKRAAADDANRDVQPRIDVRVDMF